MFSLLLFPPSDTDVEDDDEFLEYSEVTFDKSANKIVDDQYKPTIPVGSKLHSCVKSSQCRSLCALTYNQHRSRKKTLKEFVELKAKLHEDTSENNSSIGTPNSKEILVFKFKMRHFKIKILFLTDSMSVWVILKTLTELREK